MALGLPAGISSPPGCGSDPRKKNPLPGSVFGRVWSCLVRSTTAITEHHEHLCCSPDALKQTESTPGVMISMRSFITSQSKKTACLAQKMCSWISLRYMLRTFTFGYEFPDFTCASK
jgi:hypothetical protein